MYLTGQLLIAVPFINDDRFHEKVVFICGHDKQGAMGLVINQTLSNISLKILLNELNIECLEDTPDMPIYWGGPIEAGRGFILHSRDVTLESSIKINDHLFLSASLDMLDLIALNKGPRHKMIFLGYTAWASTQLDDELKQNIWINYHAQNSFIFNNDRKKLWKKAYQAMNINPEQIIASIGHA